MKGELYLKSQNNQKKRWIKDRTWIVVFMLPAILLTLALRIVPILYSVWLSFTGWRLTVADTMSTFVGLQNYLDFLKDPEYISSLVITFKIGLGSTVITLLIGTVLAFLMDQKLHGTPIVRTFLISAIIIAPIAVGTAWRLMYNPGNGLINVFIELLGFESIPFLSSIDTVIGAVIAADAWQMTPYVMIIILAGLQSMPPDIFEAARIDGANRRQILFRVTLPLLQKSFMLAILVRVMDSLRVFDIIYALTKGGPARATRNINVLMYETGFQFAQIGKASAMSVMILIIVMIPCILTVMLFNRKKGGDA